MRRWATKTQGNNRSVDLTAGYQKDDSNIKKSERRVIKADSQETPRSAKKSECGQESVSTPLRSQATGDDKPLDMEDTRQPLLGDAVSSRDQTNADVDDTPQGFGQKTISFWGSCILNFNNITGPGVVVLPLLYAQAGWFLPTAGLLLMWLASSFAATMLCEAQQRIPGNHGFRKRYEYCAVVKHYYGDRWHLVAQVGFNAGLLASNIAAMIVTSQVLDSVVQRLAGSPYAIDYHSWPPHIIQGGAMGGGGSEGGACVWGITEAGTCNTSTISMGYLLAMLVCVPFARLNLDDNMAFQWLSAIAQLAFSFVFAAQFIFNILPGSPNYCEGNGPARTPFVGVDMSQVVGVCVFAYSYVSTIPSWVNEKKNGVNINKAIWYPATLGFALNVLLGLLGAWAYRLVDSSGSPLSGTDDMLNLLDGQADPQTACGHVHVDPFTEFSVYMWGFFGYIPGIPILSIMVRYNLLSSGVVGSTGAFFWAVLAPWLLTAFTYQAQVLVQFCNLVAVFCQGFINLVVPVMLYRAALKAYPTPDELHRSAGAAVPAATAIPAAAASGVVNRQRSLLAAVCGFFSGAFAGSCGSAASSKQQLESRSLLQKESSGTVPVGGPLPVARSTVAVIRSLLCVWQQWTCADTEEAEQKLAQSPAVSPAISQHGPLSPPLLVSHAGRGGSEVEGQVGMAHAHTLASVQERDERGGNQHVQVAVGGEEEGEMDVKESHVDALPLWLIPDHRAFSWFFLWSLVAVVIAGIVSSLMF